MTLPTTINLPQPEDYESDPTNFIENLITRLEDMYENLSDNVNGTIRNYADVDSSQWIPTLAGTTASGTFTYTNQIGWVHRQGIMTEVWGNIAWGATTATGFLYVELPYLATKSGGIPFVGTCITSNITYATGTTANIAATPDTYRGLIYTSGSGVGLAIMNVPASGAIDFHLRYIGISDE